MSNTSFSNIDLWLFEWAEGNLTPEQIGQLEVFLMQHPELDVDRDLWKMARLERQDMVYPDAGKLERKRRPVAVISAAALLLLLISTGGLMWFTDQDAASSALSSTTGDSDKLAAMKEELQAKELELKELKERIESLSANEAIMLRSKNDLRIGKLSFISREELTSVRAQHGKFVKANPSLTPTELAPLQGPQGNQSQAVSTGKLYSHEMYEEQPEGPHSNFEDENQINVRALREVDIFIEEVSVERARRALNGGVSKGLDMKVSIADRLNRFGRNVKRMMDNPIALTNTRDPRYAIPGMAISDISFSSAGTLMGTRVQTFSRYQWMGAENEQLMNQVSIDGYAYGIRGGWGLQLNHSHYKDGGVMIGQAALTYSPKISVSNQFSIEPSLRFKLGDKHLNSGKMGSVESVEMDRGTALSYYEGEQQPIGQNLLYRDLGAGLLINTEWFFAGFQVDNFFRHNDNMFSNDWGSPRRRGHHYVATLGGDWKSNGWKNGGAKIMLSPYVVYQKKEALSEVWAGANFTWNWSTSASDREFSGLRIGVATSDRLEPAASIGMDFGRFSFQYSADYTQSAMTEQSELSHQLSLRIAAGKRNGMGHAYNRR